jgi:flagellar biosynthesis/type III secretory pathway M-ring protein FliF/YscJ
MKEKLLEKWNGLSKNAKIFICAVVVLVIAGALWN